MRFCVIGLAVLASGARAQDNLVPNPSFEEHIGCPFTQDELGLVHQWYNPTWWGTPDYYHECHYIGSQVPRTGGAYAGIYGMQWPNGAEMVVREYIRVLLTDSLRPGEVYCVSFYVSLQNTSALSIHSIGAYLSPKDDGMTYGQPMLVSPQIVNSPYRQLNDTSGWMRICGSYVAEGGERFMTIGNFNPSDQASGMQPMPSPHTNTSSYYYIDDVSVSKSVGAGTICKAIEPTVGMGEHSNISSRIFPNPMTTRTTVLLDAPRGSFDLELFNSHGKLVRSTQSIGNRYDLDRGSLDLGVYLLRVSDRQGALIFKERLIIE